MECLICKKTGQKVFPISLCCGDGQNTIKDDIIEFVGDSIADRLHDEQNVCNKCMHMLDDIVKRKVKVLKAILVWQDEQKYNPNLGNASSRSSSTTNKRQSRRDKNNIRSKSADVKKMRREIVKSVQSEHFDRPISVESEMRYMSFLEEEEKQHEKEVQRPNLPQLVYDGDEIIYPVKRTRSVSRSHERNVQEKEQRRKKMEIYKQYQCSSPRCANQDFGGSLNLFTSHLVVMHGVTPFYRCWVCGLEFVTNDHLNVHLESRHDDDPVICGACGATQHNVSAYQKHIDQHLSSSFKCFLCDKDFITKKECNNHIFSNHRARSYPELDYLQRKRLNEPDGESSTFDEAHVSSLGADLVYNQNLEASLRLTGKMPATPNYIFRDDWDVLGGNSATSSPVRWKRKTPIRDIARSTPTERSNIPSDDESEVVFDIPPFSASSMRDLESRNTEVADIFADL